MASCADDESDNRSYEPAMIVGIKVDGILYLPTYDDGNTVIVLPAGKDLSNVQVELLVENGKVENFTNNNYYDMRMPVNLVFNGFDGTQINTKLRVQSPPKLTNLNIERIDLLSENIYLSAKSVIVQVEKGTDLTKLVVNMEFTNGTIQGFQNGVVRDYTNPVAFSVLGVDNETVYPYDLVITTDPVGPATVKSMTINGFKTTKIVAGENNVLIPYVSSISDFTNSTVAFEVGYGNNVDPAFIGTGLDLLFETNKVKITGTNSQVTEFTLAPPQLDPEVMFLKDYASLGYAPNDLGAVGFSGNYVLAAHYTAGTKAPSFYDYSGNLIGQLSIEGTSGIGYGFRKFAADADGVIIGSSLGMSANEQWVYRWNSVTERPTNYLSFSKASLGVTYNPRAAGINVYGSLKGNATVVMPIAQQSDVFVWHVTDGTASTPEKFTSPVKFGYYAGVQPLPDDKGYILAAASAGLNGFVVLDNKFQEQYRFTGMAMTDVDVVKYNGRIYMAYVVMVGGNTPTMFIHDITDGQEISYKTPIMKMAMKDMAGNANVTADAAFKVINGKLCVAFVSSNSDFYLFKIEQ